MRRTPEEPNSERIENILRTSSFFEGASTRRTFMQRILAVSGGVALGGAVPRSAEALVGTANKLDPVTDFGNAAVGAERIGIAFYNNALGKSSPFGVRGDLIGLVGF